jgi:hypothetical protein
MARTPRRRYSPEEIERGLATLAIAGNSIKAAELTGFPDKTIREWKRTHPERYETLRTELHAKVAEQIASEAEHVAQRLGDLEHLMVDRLEKNIDQLEPRDLPGALRNVTTSKALQMDKIHGPVRERPAYVNKGTDILDLMGRMARLLGHETPKQLPSIDGTAEPA